MPLFNKMEDDNVVVVIPGCVSVIFLSERNTTKVDPFKQKKVKYKLDNKGRQIDKSLLRILY